MGAAITKCPLDWLGVDSMEERASKSLYNGEISGVEKEGDILLSCHDPSKHGRVHLLSQTKTLDVRDGKEYYYYYALKAPFVEPTSAGHNWADIIRSRVNLNMFGVLLVLYGPDLILIIYLMNLQC